MQGRQALLHRQSLQFRHLHLGHVGVFARLGLTAAAARLQAYRDEVLPGFHMHGEKQEKQNYDVENSQFKSRQSESDTNARSIKGSGYQKRIGDGVAREKRQDCSGTRVAVTRLTGGDHERRYKA